MQSKKLFCEEITKCFVYHGPYLQRKVSHKLQIVLPSNCPTVVDLHCHDYVSAPFPPVPLSICSANILLDSHLVPRLSDFGLAKECSARSSSQQSQFSTQSQVIMGTVAYMAPELFRNRKLSPKTDVYSFGVILLELYTGLAADDPAVPQRALVMESGGMGRQE